MKTSRPSQNKNADGRLLASDGKTQPVTSRATKVAARTPKKPKKQQREDLHTKLWTTARRRAIEQQVKTLQGILRLNDWTITHKWDRPCKTDAVATITPLGDSRHARLQLSPEFLAMTAGEQHQALAHEVIHCHFFALVETAITGFEAVVEGKAALVFSNSIERRHEEAVDAFADAWAPYLPPLQMPALTSAERKLLDTIETP